MNDIPLHEHLGRNTDWYDLSGPPQALTIVLVHGSTLTRHSWQSQVKQLTSQYRVVSLDLPGHGALAAFPFTFENSIRVLEVVVKITQSINFLLVGASLGGHVATLYANRHPGQVAGLVISGASMNFHGFVGGWTRLVGRLMPRLFSPAYLKYMAERSMQKKWPADTVTELLQAGVHPAGAFQSFHELPDFDFKALVNAIHAPVLILNGEADKPNRKQEQEFLLATQNGRLKTIDGAGHACAIEKPEAFTQALLEFAQQVFHKPAGS